VVRKRVASKLGLQVLIMSVRREAVSGACTSWPHIVIRLLCMMIDALRCAGIAYYYGMMRTFSFSFLCTSVLVIRMFSIYLHNVCFSESTWNPHSKRKHTLSGSQGNGKGKIEHA